MLGGVQVLGMPGVATAHYFCTLCDLDIDDLDILDPAKWPAKNLDHICHIARMYLLVLLYWNPVLYVIIDLMHALDLGLLQHHCRKLFQIDITVPGGDGFTEPPP